MSAAGAMKDQVEQLIAREVRAKRVRVIMERDYRARIAQLEAELALWAQLNPDRLARMLKAIRVRKEQGAS